MRDPVTRAVQGGPRVTTAPSRPSTVVRRQESANSATESVAPGADLAKATATVRNGPRHPDRPESPLYLRNPA